MGKTWGKPGENPGKTEENWGKPGKTGENRGKLGKTGENRGKPGKTGENPFSITHAKGFPKVDRIHKKISDFETYCTKILPCFKLEVPEKKILKEKVVIKSIRFLL